jgi:hypothetical protein
VSPHIPLNRVFGESLVSRASNNRPRTKGMRIVSKYPALTKEIGGHNY